VRLDLSIDIALRVLMLTGTHGDRTTASRRPSTAASRLTVRELIRSPTRELLLRLS
jgi:hypothetical protein